MTVTIDRTEAPRKVAAKEKPRGGALDPFFEALCLASASGDVMTVRQRLERITRHWGEHVRELQDAVAR